MEQDIEITEAQERLFAQGMLAVARCDGEVDPREAQLIAELYPGDLSSLPDPDPATLSVLSPEAGQLFLRSCLLIALADFGISPAEKSLIDGYAEALKVSPEQLADLQQSVKEYLLAPLARLANVEVAAEVAKKLD